MNARHAAGLDSLIIKINIDQQFSAFSYVGRTYYEMAVMVGESQVNSAYTRNVFDNPNYSEPGPSRTIRVGAIIALLVIIIIIGVCIYLKVRSIRIRRKERQELLRFQQGEHYEEEVENRNAMR